MSIEQAIKIAKIVSLNGRFYAKSQYDFVREVLDGDEIYAGEMVFGDDANGAFKSAIISLKSGMDIVISGNDKQLFDVSLDDNFIDWSETVSEHQSIINMFQQEHENIENENDQIQMDGLEPEAGITESLSEAKPHFESVKVLDAQENISALLRDSGLDKDKLNILDSGNGSFENSSNVGTIQTSTEDLPLFPNDSSQFILIPLIIPKEEVLTKDTVIGTLNVSGGIKSITFSIDDASPYSINETTGEVRLTQIGLDSLNDGKELVELIVTVRSIDGIKTRFTIPQTNINSVSIEFKEKNIEGSLKITDENEVHVTQNSRVISSIENDAPTIIVKSLKIITEDTLIAGSKIADFTISDTDKDNLAITLSNEEHYAIKENEIVLTKTGADLVNRGDDLPDYTLTVNDGTVDTVVNVNPVDTINVNDAVKAVDDTIEEQSIDVSLGHASINVGDTAMSFTDAFTISQTLISTGNGGMIFNKEDSYLLYQNENKILVYGFKSEANPSSWIWINTEYKLSLNEEHTVSSIYDGETNTIKLYIDAKEVFSSDVAPSGLNITEDDLLFGERGNNTLSFQGTFDDIQIHNKVLDAKEVSTIANAGVVSDGLVARYDFGGDTPLVDKSGNNNHARLQNGATLINEGNVNIVEDTQVIIKANTLLNNDTDEDGDTLSITKVEATGNTHGRVTLDDNRDIVFIPEANYNGNASFTYTVSDGKGSTATATVNFSIDSVNDAATLSVDSTAKVAEDGSVSLNFTAQDVDGSTTTTATADNGTVTVNNDGTITYTPNTNYHGTDTITLTSTDDDGATVTATSTITVNDINDAPTLTVESTKTVDEDGSTRVTFTPKDTDGTITTTSATADNGTVTVNNDGTITYTPNTDYHGTDTITVSTVDNDETTVTATSRITVNDINDAPTLTVESRKTVAEDALVSIDFNAEDVDGSITTMARAEKGKVAVNPNGTITYTPNTNYHGTDTITVSTVDNDGTTVTATSTITVNDINDAPTLTVESSKTVDEDGSTTVTFTPKDTDGTITTTSATADNGTVVVNNDGTITYTPNTDYHGTDTITVTSTDDDGATVTATSTITVNDINDAPTLTVESSKTVDEDGSTTVTFTPKDTDGTITTTSATADNGTVVVNNDGTITYTPNTDYHGTDTITLTTTDDDGATVTATSTITVNDINDAPTLTVESTKTVDEDGSTTVTFTPKDTDGTITTTSATADNGTVTVNNDGTITYTPNTDYHGTDTTTRNSSSK